MATSKEREVKNQKGHLAMKKPPIVSPQEWEAARQAAARKGEGLHPFPGTLWPAERRRMPWLAVEKKYEFDGPKGQASLLDLFDGRPSADRLPRLFSSPECSAGPSMPAADVLRRRPGSPPRPSERSRHQPSSSLALRPAS